MSRFGSQQRRGIGATGEGESKRGRERGRRKKVAELLTGLSSFKTPRRKTLVCFIAYEQLASAVRKSPSYEISCAHEIIYFWKPAVRNFCEKQNPPGAIFHYGSHAHVSPGLGIFFDKTRNWSKKYGNCKYTVARLRILKEIYRGREINQHWTRANRQFDALIIDKIFSNVKARDKCRFVYLFCPCLSRRLRLGPWNLSIAIKCETVFHRFVLATIRKVVTLGKSAGSEDVDGKSVLNNFPRRLLTSPGVDTRELSE